MTYEDFASNIPKWLFLSVSQHFKEIVATSQFKMFVQGQAKTSSDKEQKDFFELRTDGPYLRPRKTKGFYSIEYQVNTLIQSTIDDKSFNRPYVDMGKILTAFVSIPVYRYGDGNLDDETFIGCLKTSKQGRLEEIRVNQFGIVDTALGLIQATIEAHYTLEIDLKKL